MHKDYHFHGLDEKRIANIAKWDIELNWKENITSRWVSGVDIVKIEVGKCRDMDGNPSFLHLWTSIPHFSFFVIINIASLQKIINNQLCLYLDLVFLVSYFKKVQSFNFMHHSIVKYTY